MPQPALSIVPAGGTWVARADGAVIGDSDKALEVVEGGGPAVIYFPVEDVGMVFLEPSRTDMVSRRLGATRYYSLVTGNQVLADAAWSHEAPPEAAGRLAGHVAFDTRVVAVEET